MISHTPPENSASLGHIQPSPQQPETTHLLNAANLRKPTTPTTTLKIADDLSREEWLDWHATLTPLQLKEHRVAIMASGIKAGATLTDIGKKFDLSWDRVRQILRKSGLQVREARRLRREQSQRHAARFDSLIYDSSLKHPELDLEELAQWWDTDVVTVRRALKHRASIHETRVQETPPRAGQDELIVALKKWAAQTTKVTGDDYTKWACENDFPGKQTIAIRFGSWNQALTLAGLDQHISDRGGFRPQIEDEAIWASVYEFFSTERPKYSAAAYDKWAKDQGLVSLATVRNRLGTWNEVKLRIHELMKYAARSDGESSAWADAVLSQSPLNVVRKISSVEECIESLRRVADSSQGVLTLARYEELRSPTDVSGTTLLRRCGTWLQAITWAGLENRASAKLKDRLNLTD